MQVKAIDKHDDIEVQGLVQLVSNSGIKEPFDFDAECIYIAREDNKILGCVVYRLQKIGPKKMPRFIHVILDNEIKRSKKAVLMLIKSQRLLKKDGYKDMFAYIFYKNKHMAVLAKKFGFTEWFNDELGEYLYKKIGD